MVADLEGSAALGEEGLKGLPRPCGEGVPACESGRTDSVRLSTRAPDDGCVSGVSRDGVFETLSEVTWAEETDEAAAERTGLSSFMGGRLGARDDCGVTAGDCFSGDWERTRSKGESNHG